MRLLAGFAVLIARFLSPPPASAWQQALPPQPGKGQAICVAVVANAGAKSAFVERMTERLTKSLKDNKLKALMMDSATTPQRKLEPTAENGEESRQKDCDSILLTQILDPQAHPP
jgi:DNA-binding transcriptional regulator YbjK